METLCIIHLQFYLLKRVIWMLSHFSRVQLCGPMGCGPPGSSIHEILQARILERVAVSSSRESSWPRDWTCVSYLSCIGRQVHKIIRRKKIKFIMESTLPCSSTILSSKGGNIVNSFSTTMDMNSHKRYNF